MRKTSLVAVAALIALGGMAGVQDARAQDDEVRVEMGILTCRMTDRTNLIVVSETKFDCVFDHADGRDDERFLGVIDKLGADLSIKGDETLVWAVLAPSVDAKVSAMEGTYVGVGADVSLGKGVGANALFGGLDKSFALQPVSVSTSDGVGVTLAVESLRLDYTGQAE
jgi:hypothetical protein